MNKYIKHLIGLVLLGLSGWTFAQYIIGDMEYTCPIGANWNDPRCIRTPVENNDQTSVQAAPQPAQPLGEWQEAWGAVATDGIKGILGASTDMSDSEQAKATAMRECKMKGGNPCTIQVAYKNQCSALVTGDKIFLVTLGASENEASKQGMVKCSSEDVNCRVYYSACSKPRFIKY